MSFGGVGTELGIMSMGYILIREVIAPLIKRIPIVQQKINNRNGKGNRNNPTSTNPGNSKPGFSKTCMENGLAIARLETDLGLLRTEVDRQRRNVN